MGARGGICSIPVHGRIRKADVEVRHHWLPVDLHISRRREISAFDVLKFVNQCLLRGAGLAGVPLNSALIDHDGEGESGMVLRSCHDKLGRSINSIPRPIPVDNHSVNSAAYHIVDLALDLGRIGLAVTDVHVIGLAKP